MVFVVILGLLKFGKNSPIKPKTCHYCPMIISPADKVFRLWKSFRGTGLDSSSEGYSIRARKVHTIFGAMKANERPFRGHLKGLIGDILTNFRTPKMTRKTVLTPPTTQPI